MKRALILVLILLTLTNFSFAQKATQENGDFKYQDTKLKKKKKVESYMLIQEFLQYASTLDLTDSQRQELDNVKENYLYPMMQREADFQISEMRVSDMLKAPNFDPEKIKKAIEISITLTHDNAIMSIDALDAIRKAVGIDNFNKVREMMNLTAGGMIESDDKEKNNQDPSNGQNRAL
jgi:Spy/CpxP family protein refolding chaperone